MTTLQVLLPVFAQVGLTFALLFATAMSRVRALKRKEVRVGDIALGQPAWPQRPTQIANAFRNQFELPVLFYAVVALAIVTGQVTLAFVVLAWVFVAFRYAHAFIHTGSNYVPHRFYTFAGSVFAAFAMWIVFAVQAISAAP